MMRTLCFCTDPLLPRIQTHTHKRTRASSPLLSGGGQLEQTQKKLGNRRAHDLVGIQGLYMEGKRSARRGQNVGGVFGVTTHDAARFVMTLK